MMRGHTLILEKSHLYARGRVLRDALSLKTVATPNSQRAAEAWCRRYGYSWMPPVANISLSDLEEKI